MESSRAHVTWIAKVRNKTSFLALSSDHACIFCLLHLEISAFHEMIPPGQIHKGTIVADSQRSL